MKKNLIIYFFSIIFSLGFTHTALANAIHEPLLMEIRDQLPRAFDNYTTCENLYQKSIKKTTTSPVLKGYIGAVHLAKSKHVSIFKKMGFFNKGIKLLEEAIVLAPNEVELRFLRLTIQLNLPGFLNYSNNIKEDKRFVLDNYHKALPNLQARMVNFVKTSGHFSQAEMSRM